jgi:protein-tyrosine phosphatase
LRAGGFDVVLNLTEFEPARAEFAAAGLEADWISFPSTYPPDAAAEEAYLAALPRAYALLQNHLRADRKVLVHCSWGRDRTGILLAYYLARTEGLHASEAIARVREFRPKAMAGWEPMAERILSVLLNAPE